MVSDSVTAAKFEEWSAPVNLGPLVNSPFDDISARVSAVRSRARRPALQPAATRRAILLRRWLL